MVERDVRAQLIHILYKIAAGMDSKVVDSVYSAQVEKKE